MKNLTTLLFAAIFLSACKSEYSIPPELLGNWRGVNWTVEGQESGRDVSAVQFKFSEADYEAIFGEQQEKGRFKVIGETLYTNAEGQMEKKVRIVKLVADSLVLEMNRAGTKEELTLIKE